MPNQLNLGKPPFKNLKPIDLHPRLAGVAARLRIKAVLMCQGMAVVGEKENGYLTCPVKDPESDLCLLEGASNCPRGAEPTSSKSPDEYIFLTHPSHYQRSAEK